MKDTDRETTEIGAPSTDAHLQSPLRLDAEASLVMGEGILVDRAGHAVATGLAIEEAFAEAARRNGTTVDDEIARTRTHEDYLSRVRTAGIPDSAKIRV